MTFLSGNKGDAESMGNVPDAPKTGELLVSKYSSAGVCPSSEDVSVYMCFCESWEKGSRWELEISHWH